MRAMEVFSMNNGRIKFMIGGLFIAGAITLLVVTFFSPLNTFAQATSSLNPDEGSSSTSVIRPVVPLSGTSLRQMPLAFPVGERMIYNQKAKAWKPCRSLTSPPGIDKIDT